MEYFFPCIAFVGCWVCGSRSLGAGLSAVFAVGYFNGIVRANYLGIATTFMFDFAVTGLYMSFLTGTLIAKSHLGKRPLFKWVVALTCWPLVLTFVPINDLFVQMVALRGTVWYLPVMVLAMLLKDRDLNVIAWSLATLNIIALMFGLAEYFMSIEPFYPRNAVTEIMYRSGDVANNSYYRIPSTFLSAHAYGGTMVATLPFLLGRIFSRQTTALEMGLMAAGLIAAAGGMLMCAARQPLVVGLIVIILVSFLSRLSPRLLLVLAAMIGGMLYVASSNERLQRILTLEETGDVASRVRGSANEDFLVLISDYPIGAGMGSSVGTSIPFFLLNRAPIPIGLENEYSRILVDQGWVGLILWGGFLAWLLHRPPSIHFLNPWDFGRIMMYAIIMTTWATAFIGTGTLAAIPGSVILLSQMGIVANAVMQRKTERPPLWAGTRPGVSPPRLETNGRPAEPAARKPTTNGSPVSSSPQRPIFTGPPLKHTGSPSLMRTTTTGLLKSRVKFQEKTATKTKRPSTNMWWGIGLMVLGWGSFLLSVFGYEFVDVQVFEGEQSILGILAGCVGGFLMASAYWNRK